MNWLSDEILNNLNNKLKPIGGRNSRRLLSINHSCCYFHCKIKILKFRYVSLPNGSISLERVVAQHILGGYIFGISRVYKDH